MQAQTIFSAISASVAAITLLLGLLALIVKLGKLLAKIDGLCEQLALFCTALQDLTKTQNQQNVVMAEIEQQTKSLMISDIEQWESIDDHSTRLSKVESACEVRHLKG